VFQLDGVRRALLAYWSEALTGLRERGSLSLYARHHNYNAVAKIVDSLRHEEKFFADKMAGRRKQSESPKLGVS